MNFARLKMERERIPRDSSFLLSDVTAPIDAEYLPIGSLIGDALDRLCVEDRHGQENSHEQCNADQPHDSQERVRQIVDRARHETGLRDLATFCITRIWTVLLILRAVCSAWYASKGSQTYSPDANLDSTG